RMGGPPISARPRPTSVPGTGVPARDDLALVARAAVCAFLALSVVRCGGAGGATPAAPAAANEKTVPAVRVATAPVEVRDLASSIQALGSIEAEEEIQVVAAVEGVVTRVDFHEGDRVTPKSVIAEIDPERYRLQAERAKARYDQTE